MRAHGTHVRYVHGPDVNDEPGHGCRCEPCRTANRDYERERNRRAAPPYVAAGPAREHIAWLRDQGIGLNTVAKLSGVSHGALTKLVYGTLGRSPSKRCRPETLSKIVGVLPPDVVNGSRVEAGPTWVIIETLLARGWSKSALARHVHGPHAIALQLSTAQVTRENAATIKGLLELPVERRLSRWGTPCGQPNGDAGEPDRIADATLRKRRERARQRAEAEGAEPDQAVADLDDPYRLPKLVVDDDLDVSWRAHGACRRPEIPSWLFFPARGDMETVQRAKAVCAGCPVAEQCLEFALLLNEPGVWGGTTGRERRELRKERVA